MKTAALGLLLAVAVAGCGSTTGGNKPQRTNVAAASTPTVVAPAPASTAGAPAPTAAAVATPSAPYRSFVAALCRALATGNTSSVAGDLSNYQYNTGVRWGYMGDGEGQTSDPSIFSTWLSGKTVKCAYFTPDNSGHGALLTQGWKITGGPWSIIELDTYGGRWRINDFTFGRPGVLYRALLTAGPAIRL